MFRWIVYCSLALLAAQSSLACVGTDFLSPGETLTLSPPHLTLANGNYKIYQKCQWQYTAPVGYKILMTCSPFRLVTTSSCNGDRLTVDAKKYCSNAATLSVESKTNAIDIKLDTVTQNGNLNCRVTTKTNPCACGRRKTTRIVGGTTTLVNEFPHQAALVDDTGKVVCSATIISEFYVMTAAHCVKGADTSKLKVVVGEHDTSTTSETDATKKYSIAETKIHEGYNSDTSANDIALVRTSAPIEFSDKVGVACLPFKFQSEEFAMSKVTTAGWGTLEFGGPQSKTLQKVDLDTVSLASCKTEYPGAGDGILCTKTANKDTCQHDSGSGLFHTDPSNNRMYAVGIVSGGTGCAGSKPSLNMRVTSYLGWIQSKATGATFCNI